MNKILSSIIGGLLGVTMAASVGVATFAGSNAKEAKAATSTITLIPNQSNTGNSSTSYVTTAHTFTYSSVSWTMNQWNPKSLQIKTNQNSATSEFNFYTGVFPGSITSVVLTFSDLTLVSTSSTGMYVALKSSAYSSLATSGGNQLTWSSTNKTLTWTGSASSGYKAISFYQNGKVATGTNKIASIAVTYDTGSTPTPTEYEYSDIITRAKTGIAYGSNRYEEWSGLQLTSAATYAGCSAGDYDSVQIRTTNNNSGVVTTASGGTVKNIVLKFRTNTTSGRKVHIYGNSSAYSSAEDLFDSTTRGTSIELVEYTSGTTEYTVTPESSYAYVGLRSTSGAVYLESVTITWTTTTQQKSVSSLSVTTNPDTTIFGVGEKLVLTGMVVTATYSDSTSAATVNYTTSPVEGYTFVVGDVGSKTLTVTSSADTTKTTTITLTVVNAYPTKLERTSPAVYSSTMKLNEGTGRFKATFTDASTVTDIKVGDSGTELYINDVAVDTNSLAANYANQNATIKYTNNGKTVQYTFKVVVEDDLLIDHFDDVPEYVLSGESATINAHFTSFIGMPETITVTSLEPSNLTATFNQSDVTYNSTTYIGEIPITVTGGNTAGQYNVSVTIEKDGETASNTCAIIVREAAPGHEGSGSYEKITTTSSDMSGKYVIAANVDGTYLAMNAEINNKSKMTVSEITAENNIVTSSSSSYSIFELSKNGSNYNIKNGTRYLRYSGSSTNLAFADNNDPYGWTISTTSSGLGTFRLIASSTANDNSPRALAYHAPKGTGVNNVFGPYTISNLSTSKTGDSGVSTYEYYEIELFKYNGSDEEETGATEFELVKSFVDNYMHMDDIAVTNTDDTGACRGSSGYYATAKAAWNSMVSSYTGSMNLKDIFEERFPDAYERYITWAEKCGDNSPFDGNAAPSSSKSSIVNIESNSATSIIVIVVSLITITSVGAYITLRKKKEVK